MTGILERARKFALAHKLCLAGTVAGIFFGPAFCAGGLIAGFFGDIILEKIKDEKHIASMFKKEQFGGTGAEPFPGSTIVCALAVSALSDAEGAGKIASIVFKGSHPADWVRLCQIAKESGPLNSDLLTESLASKILHEKIDSALLGNIFMLLRACEFNWDEKNRGEKPSVYLAQLLNYQVQNDELENAYSVLGLEKNASMSEVKKSHRALAAKYHPDSATGNEELFIKVQDAYESIAHTVQAL